MNLFSNKKKEISLASIENEEEKKIEKRFYDKFRKDYEDLKKLFFNIKRVEAQLNLPLLKKNIDFKAGRNVNPEFEKNYLRETEELLEKTYEEIIRTNVLKNVNKFVKELKRLKKERKKYYQKNNIKTNKIEEFYDEQIRSLKRICKTSNKLMKKIKQTTNNNMIKVLAVLNVITRLLYMTSLCVFLMKEGNMKINEGILSLEVEASIAQEDFKKSIEKEDVLEVNELEEVMRSCDNAISACA